MKYLLLIAFLALGFLADAQTIQVYGFQGAAGNEATLPPNGQPTNGTLSNIRRGSGILPNNAVNAFSSLGFSMASSIDTADYYEFQIKSNSGYVLNLDSIVVSERRSNTGIRTFAVRSSLDNFGSDVSVTQVPDDNLTRNNQRTPLGSAFKNIASSTTLAFRYYGYGAEADAGTWRLDSIRIYGTISQSGTGSTPSLKWKATTANVVEGSPITLTVKLSSPATSGIAFKVMQKSGNISTADYSIGSGNISNVQIAAGVDSANIVVNATLDGLAEQTETAVWALRLFSTGFTIGGDSLLNLSIQDMVVPPTFPPTRTIAQVRGANAGNAADSTGRNVRLFGTVYGVNQRLTTVGGGYQMYLRDATGGIGIFKSTNFPNIPVLNEGDSVKVMGTINVFRGLSQITPDSMVVLATGRSLKNPTVVLKVNESLESDLVRINGVQLVDPTKWTTNVGGSGFTVRVFKGTDTTDVRIDNDCPLYSQPSPTGTFDIVGMGSQFTVNNNAPWNGGYQMIPRKLADVITSPVVGPKPKLSFSTTALTFTESAGNQVCPIVMSSTPSVNTSPTIYVKGGTATMLLDYASVSSVNTTIGPGTQLTNNLPVEFLDDAVVEGSETLIMVIRKAGLPSDTAFEIGADSIFTFTITDNDAPLPSGPPFTRTIEQVRGSNTGNQADSTGRNVRLYGTVYGLNQRLTTAGGGYQMYLRDATGGIGLFKTTNFANIPVLNEGDSVKVMGTINAFRGLSQITPDSMVVLATGRSLKNPTITLKVDESLESDLVRINGVQLVDPTKWTTGVGATGFAVKVFKGNDTTELRIDNDCPLYNQPAPTGTFDVIGMGSQFIAGNPAPVAPFSATGYQVIPRSPGDLISTPVVTPKPILSFTSPGLTFTESNGNQSFQIQMDAMPSVITSPNVFIKGGTASAGTDYVFVGSISTVMGPGTQLIASLPLQFIDDVVMESTETVTLAIRKTGQSSDTAYEIGADSIFTFTITDNDISVTEPLPPTRKIAEIRGNNTGNQADSVGKSFRVYGTIYGHNQRTAGTGYQMFIRDETGGIGIFKTSTVSGIQNLTEGDSIKIMGKVEVFRGLSQINPDSIVLLATNRPIMNPEVVSNIGETEEAKLVRFNNVTLVNSGAWTTGTGASGFTVQITDGTNITDVRIDNDCPLYNQPAPTGAFDLIGMGSQFVPGTPAPVAPFPATGYQLIPRRNSDLIPAGTPTGPVASFAVASQSVSESNDTVRVNVLIAPAPAEAYKIQVIIKGGTASAGSDFESPATILNFPANASSAQFKIKLNDDAILEGAETIQLVLRKDNTSGFPPFANVGQDSLHTVTILANDGSTQEPFPPTRTIAVIRGANTGNQADSVGKNVRVYGTIYGLNQRLTPTGAGYQMFIRDATGGIGVFKTSLASGIPTLTEGDSVKIMGTVNVFRGLSQITPDSMVVLATGRPIKTPAPVTVLNEVLEGDLVILNGPLTLVDPTAWTTGTGATGFTVKVTDGTNVTDVRIDNDCELYNQAAPTSPFTLTGMGSQFASGTAPWVGGYQLIPRRAADLQIIEGVDPVCQCKVDLKAMPNPGTTTLTLNTKEKSGYHYTIFNSMGQKVFQINDAEANETIRTESWAAGIYTIKVQETGRVIRWIKK